MTPAEASNIYRRIDEVKDMLTKELGELRACIADLKAALDHPDPNHCTRTKEIEALSARVDGIAARLATIEQAKWRVTGAWQVIYFLLGVAVAIALKVWIK